MNRLKGYLLLSINAIVWILTLLVSIPLLILNLLYSFLKRIFIKSE